MKKFLKSIVPYILLVGYSIIAGGSLEDIGISLAITLGVCVVVGIIVAIVTSINNDKKRKEGMAKAEEQFGSHTKEVEYELGKYILLDEPNHRILLKDSIMDSQKIKELKITRKEPKTTVTYKEEAVTKTSSGSAIGRGVVGALVAGPVGAVVGGATAKRTTETKKTPEYHTTPGRYTIEVIDLEGNSRAKFVTSDKSKHEEVRMFLQAIIDINTMGERLALEQAKEDDHNRLLSSNVDTIAIGATSENLKDILINSEVVETEEGEAYKLCHEAVGLINKAWNAGFEKVLIGVRDNMMYKMRGTSNPYSVSTFKNMQLDMRTLSEHISAKYGTPQVNAEEVSYISLTDDNNRINAYSWGNKPSQVLKLDYICDNGKYKYEFNADSI